MKVYLPIVVGLHQDTPFFLRIIFNMNIVLKQKILAVIEDKKSEILEIDNLQQRIEFVIQILEKIFQSKDFLSAIRDDNINSMFAFQDRITISPIIEALKTYRETGVKNRIVGNSNLDQVLMSIYEIVED